MVWVDAVFYSGHDEDDLLRTLELILDRLEEVGLFAASHKVRFFRYIDRVVRESIAWCGKVYPHGEIKHDRERISGLAILRFPETVNWLSKYFAASDD